MESKWHVFPAGSREGELTSDYTAIIQKQPRMVSMCPGVHLTVLPTQSHTLKPCVIWVNVELTELMDFLLLPSTRRAKTNRSEIRGQTPPQKQMMLINMTKR